MSSRRRPSSTRAKPQQRASHRGQSSQRGASNTGHSSHGRGTAGSDRDIGMKDSMFGGAHHDGGYPMTRGDGKHYNHIGRGRGGRISSHGRNMNRSYRDKNREDTKEEESALLASTGSLEVDPPSYSASKGVSFAPGTASPSRDSGTSRTSRTSHASRASHKHRASEMSTFVNMNWCDAEVLTYCPNQRVMYIMRGLPGSGKSTIAHNMTELYRKRTAFICSADDFRKDSSGEYIWSEETLHQTHLKCEQKANELCRKGVHIIIIDNTNIKYGDIIVYLRMAHKYDYVVNFITMNEQQSDVLAKRNIHKVPVEKIVKMRSNFYDILAYYYGWCIGREETMLLKDTYRKIFRFCINIPAFKQFATRYAPRGSQFDPKNIFQIYSMKNATTTSTTCHVTTCFTNKGKVSHAKKYSNSKLVNETLGSIYQMKVIGWCITKKSLFARVSLTEEQKKLWGSDDSLNDEKNELAIESSIWEKIAKPEEENTEFEADWGKLEVMLDGMNLNSNDVKIANFIQNIDESYILPNFGVGSTAHITLGIAGGGKAVDARKDLQEILQLELNETATREWNLPESLLRSYGSDFWIVYLKCPMFVSSMFAGIYFHE